MATQEKRAGTKWDWDLIAKIVILIVIPIVVALIGLAAVILPILMNKGEDEKHAQETAAAGRAAPRPTDSLALREASGTSTPSERGSE
jgi:hypothetical protein